MVIFPAVFSLIAGYTVRKEATGIPGVALVDEDQTLISAGFIERLTAHPGIRAEALSREEAYGKLEAYKVEAVFVITRGFGEKIEAGEAKELLEYTMLPSSYSEGYFLEVFAGQVMTLLSREMSLDKCAAAYKGAGLEVGAIFTRRLANILIPTGKRGRRCARCTPRCKETGKWGLHPQPFRYRKRLLRE